MPTGRLLISDTGNIVNNDVLQVLMYCEAAFHAVQPVSTAGWLVLTHHLADAHVFQTADISRYNVMSNVQTCCQAIFRFLKTADASLQHQTPTTSSCASVM